MESERHEQYLQFASCKLIRILDQGSGEVFLVKSEIQKIFAGTIRNSAQGIHNPASDWNLDPSSTDEESRIQCLQFGIHNPRLPWITLHQWGNTVLALVTLAHSLIAQQQITHRSYLIRL